MRITFLAENCRIEREDLLTEHGLSIYIEHDGVNILFDTGASGLFLHNAETLGVDLKRTDYAVLSHGHYDHGRGLRHFLEFHPKAPVFLSEYAFSDLYNLTGPEPRFIGLDSSLKHDFAGRYRPVRKPTEISPNVWLLTDIPGHFPKPLGNRTLMEKLNESFVPDPFRHELILCILAGGRMFCFTGCSHNGVLNMLAVVHHRFPAQKKILVGGFHMMNPKTGRLEEEVRTVRGVAEAIRDDEWIEAVITCHCTGAEAYTILKDVLEEKLRYGATGKVFHY